MEETINISNGAGLIDIKDGSVETVVYVNGNPISIGWNDCAGSVAQHLASTSLEKDEIERHIDNLRWIVNEGIPEGMSLKDSFEPLLLLLTNGDYILTLYDYPNETFDSLNLIEVNSNSRNGIEHFYPYDTLTRLQRRESLNTQRIRDFEDIISKGKRPIIICLTTELSYQFFILDGHHKAEAYLNKKITPSIMVIEKTHKNILSETETRSAINRLEPKREEELIKLKKAHNRVDG